MDKFKELEELIANIKRDISKVYEKNNKAAGVRARKGLQDVRSLAMIIRKGISEQKKL